ncbi:MAG: hypothetical protein P1V35_02590 [Planctomycetota bacterium]|nr:hypothetical protein [Planctomycetota bacterium]
MLARLSSILLALVVGSLFLYTGLSRETAEIDIRIRPKRTPVGKLFQHFPAGQLFRCDFNDLQRLDVLFVRQGPGPTEGVTLELRRIEDEAAGDFLTQPVIRRVDWTPSAETKGRQWATFLFEIVPQSKGASFHLALRPTNGAPLSNWAPWSTMRATQGEFRPWKGPPQTDPGTLDFQPVYNDLQAIAIGVNGLDAAAGECRMDIFQLPQDPKSTEEPKLVRQGGLGHNAPTASGYAFFTFDPIPDSRWKRYRLALTLPKDARVMTLRDVPKPRGGGQYNDGPTAVFYHGVGDAPPALIGQTIHGSLFQDRDLIFRAFGEDGVKSNWNKAAARGASKRFLLGLGFWALAMGLALRMVFKAPNSA